MDPDLGSLRSIAHPLRLQILSLLTGTAMSAAEVARELDVSHANASYHLRVLLDAGELVVEGEEKIRGGTAKRYRHVWDAPRPEPTALDPDSAAANIRAVASELVRRHGLRDPDARGATTISDADLWVAPEVWDEVLAAVKHASGLLHASARPPRAAGTIHVNLTAAAFRMAP